MTELRAFTMPKWGIEMTEGTIAEWMVPEGGTFAKGETITLIETDKITNEVEAEFDATLARIIVAPGTAVPVGTLLAIFAIGEASAGEIDAFAASFKPADTRMASAGGEATRLTEAEAAAPVLTTSTQIDPALLISPSAHREVEVLGVDANAIDGSGRNGRITLQDVRLYLRPTDFTPSVAPVDIQAKGAALDGHFASPLAKRLATMHGIDLSTINGTGPRGRISRADVMSRVASPVTKGTASAATAVPPPQVADDGPFEALPMSTMRKAIARQLTLSKQTIPHFYLRFPARLDAIGELRRKAKEATGGAPSLNDYIVRAAALALKAHPDINVQIHGETIHRFEQANIAIAVETERGLVTPVVRAAENRSVAAISAEIKTLSERARTGRLQTEEMKGGSFTISNLGMFGIECFDAIINPPQGAILAVGAGVRKPVDANHALAFATVAMFSLSCDHRAIDGAVGARFCKTLAELLEDPVALVTA